MVLHPTTLTTFEENDQQVVGIPNTRLDKHEGTYRWGEGTTPVTMACPDGRKQK